MPFYPELKDTAFSNHENASVKNNNNNNNNKNRVVEWKALVSFKTANL